MGPLLAGNEVFVRKLRRKRHWAPSAPVDEQQLAAISQDVFLYDMRPYSLYRARSDQDLDRIALALNAGRDSLSEECFFVLFAIDEVRSAGIAVHQSPGETPCRLANAMHVEFDADSDQIAMLVASAIAAQRSVVRRAKKDMKLVAESAAKEQCLAAIPDSPRCQVSGCVPEIVDSQDEVEL